MFAVVGVGGVVGVGVGVFVVDFQPPSGVTWKRRKKEEKKKEEQRKERKEKKKKKEE